MSAKTRDNPEFSWSYSRARMLAGCARQYAYYYYVAHRGWERGASEEARMAYRLKKLTTLPSLIGGAVHERGREYVEAILAGHEPPTLQDAILRTGRYLNAVWRASKNREAFVQRPSQSSMLLEVYYRREPSSGRLTSLAQRYRTCLTNMWNWFERTDLARAKNIMLFDPLDPITYAGHRLYGAPDLVFGISEGDGLEIVDFKTGATAGTEAQLGVYAVYLLATGKVSADTPLVGRVVGLNPLEETTIGLDRAALKAAERRIDDSVWAMRGYLVDLDAERNEAVTIERFFTSATEQACTNCPFHEICPGPDADAPPGPFLS